MFQFDYASSDVKQKLCEYQKGGVFWDEMVEDELKPVLQQLRATGETISDVGINICGINHQITGRTFEIVYAVFPEKKLIKFYECNFLSQDIDWREILRRSLHFSIGEINIPPNWDKLAIQETTKGEKELTIKLLQDIFKQLDITDCGGKTEPRRAQSVRGLINWVSREAGIPIRREGQKHLQEYLDLDIFNYV